MKLLPALGLLLSFALACGSETAHGPCGSTLSGGDVACDASIASTDTGADAATGSADGGSTDAGVVTVNNFVFVTSTMHSPRLGGLAGADMACSTRAAAAGLPGRYVAWLSTSSVDAKDRLGSARGWVRTDGRPFADTQADLLALEILYPIGVDELGRAPASNDDVMTGTRADGTASSGSCSDWTSTMGSGGVTSGSVVSTGRHWTQTITRACTQAGRLYCFGVDRSAPLAFTPASGRKAFLLNAFSPRDGIANADSACQSAAGTAGLTGEYRALLATSIATAASRFSAAGPTWVRIDGVELASSAADLLAGRWISGLNVTASGEHVAFNYVWTGAETITREGDPTCSDWAGGGEALAGEAGFSDGRSFRAVRLPCNASAALYCLER